MKMAGRMGARRVTSKGISVVRVDKERNLLFVEGAVPGSRGGYVLIRKAG
jgi:large subunit ribosomal protein L3